MLSLALREGDPSTIRMLIETTTLSQSDLDLALLQSVVVNHDDIVRILVEGGANINTQDEDGRTPFYLSLLCRRLSLSNLLLEYGCDVDVCKTNQSNALHYASKLGDLRLLQLLVAGGADLNMTNWGGNTAVLIACRFGHRDVVQYLIEAGARIDICNRLGHYPLHYAAYYDDIELINVLISHGARGDCHTYLGVTPLMLACQRQKCAAVNTLAPLSNLEYRERLYGGTALFWAIHSSCKHCMKTLMDQGADPDARDNSGRTILIQAIQSNAVSILELLLNDFYSEQLTSLLHKPSNKYALHFACFLGYKDCVRKILHSPEANQYLNYPDLFGDTPVKIALRSKNVSLTRLLIEEFNASLNDTLHASYTSAQLDLQTRNKVTNLQNLPMFHHEFFKTYSSVKMGMIDLLQSSEEVQIVAPVSSAGFDFNTWLDHGPDAFNLKVTSLELTDWLKTHMQSPLSLRECCRGYLRRLLGYRASEKVESMAIPTPIKNFLNMKELSDLKADDITIGNIKSHPWVDIE